jgi:hypothetical protein
MEMEGKTEESQMDAGVIAKHLHCLIKSKRKEGKHEAADKLQKAYDHVSNVSQNEASSENPNEDGDMNEIGELPKKSAKPKVVPKTNAANMPLAELKSKLPGYTE